MIEFWTYFEPQTLRLLCEAFDSALRDASNVPELQTLGAYSLRHVLARRIITAAQHGERDPGRLREAALGDFQAL